MAEHANIPLGTWLCAPLVALFSLQELMQTLISNTHHKFRSDSASLPHSESKNNFKDLCLLVVLTGLNNTQGTQTVANRVSSMEHQIRLYFNASLLVYMKSWWEMSTVSIDALLSVYSKWIAGLVTLLLILIFL